MSRAPRTPSRFAGLVGLGAVLLILCSSAPAQAADDKYVAMGDSYSSGTGTGDYFEPNCERSNSAYHRLLDGSLPGSPTAAVVACGGATTGNVLNSGQQGNPAQANDPALGPNTEYVSISIGGNDAGFSSVLLECGQPSWISDCDQAVDGAQNTINNTLPGRLNNVYDRIRSEAPNARVTVVGYPRIFKSPGEDCNAATFFDGGEMSRLNQTADLLADVTRAQAQANGFGFADARGAFIGHAVCDDEWLNGLSNPTGESFHPNKKGHLGYEGIVGSALRSQESPVVQRGANGRIAFVRGSAGEENLFEMNSSGGFQLASAHNGSGVETDPAYSPDGTKVAFASNRAGNYEIYVANADGSGTPLRLTSNAATDREPTWSPNGLFVAFSSTRTTSGDIYKMNADGSNQQQLTANTAAESNPAWSPDGAEIAYQRGGQIWKLNSDGQGQTQLTSSGTNEAPDYSPANSQIAFQSNRDGGNVDIYTMSSTGGSQTRRTTSSGSDTAPAWSPDGASIAFSSNRDGDNEIFTMTASGSSQTQRTTDSSSDAAPTWQGDRTAPQTTIGPDPSGTINTATPAFELDSSEVGSTFQCRVDSGSFSSCTSPHQTQTLGEGTHTFRARAIDPSGNVDATPAERTFTIEAPVGTAITSGPSGPVSTPTATFGFDAANPATIFVCLVDDVVVSEPCVSEFTTAALADGPHTFTVRGTDGVNTSEDSSDFVVDTLTPDTSLASGPGAVTNQTRPSFELAAEEGSTFECRIGAEPFAPCTSPFAPGADLADGAHTFEARATDPAGNAEADPLVVGFEVDTDAPGAVIDSGPPGATDPPAAPTATNDNQHPFTFSSGDGTASFECRLDSLDESDWVACESPFAPAAPLTDGSHVFEVRSVDEAGNAGDPASRRFVVDATAPETAITGGPAEGAEVKDAAYEFEAPSDADAVFSCRIDGVWEDCDSGATLVVPGTRNEDGTGGQPLAEGPHTFEVKAVDQLGNEDSSAEARAFTIDRTGPGAPSITGPSGPTNDATPSFGFSGGGDAEAFECRVDENPFAPCTTGHTTAALNDGPHSFQVRALDEAQNRSLAATRSIRVDVTAPTLTITGPALTNDTTPTFALNANETLGLDGFSCEVDSQAVACGDSVTAPPRLEGTHTVAVTASDEAGNEAAASRTFVVDVTAPNTTLGAGPSGAITDSTPAVSFSGGGVADSYECRVDSGAYTSCASPWTTPNLGDGAHTAQARTVDEAGNADPTPATWSFTVDTTAPQATIDAGPREVTREPSHAFTFSAPGASRFECALDGSAFAACTSPYSTGPLGYGDHNFAVRAYDSAGNRGPAAVRPFTIVTASNDFSIAKPKLNTKRGTADLPVTLPDRGKLELAGKGLERVTKAVSKPGTTKLRIAASGSAAGRLEDEGALKLVARVTFTPEGGEAKTRSKRIKLVLR